MLKYEKITGIFNFQLRVINQKDKGHKRYMNIKIKSFSAGSVENVNYFKLTQTSDLQIRLY